MGTGKGNEERYKQIVIYGATAILSVVFLGIGHVLEVDEKKLAAHIFDEIGIAGIVAIILAITVEYQSKKMEEKRHVEDREAEVKRQEKEREDIKKDVFAHVLGHRLPPGTFAELDSQILNAHFIRRNFMVEYKLSLLQEDPRFVKIDGTLSYEIRNMTPDKKPYLFKTSIEMAPVKELNHLVKYKSVSVKGCAGELVLDNEEKAETEVDLTRTPNHKVISKSIEIEPGIDACALVKFDLIRALQGGYSFVLTRDQTLGFDLIVEVPIDQIEVSATAYLPENLGKGNKNSETTGNFHWVLRRPILPYQGVYLTWKPKVIAEGNQAAGAEKSVEARTDPNTVVTKPAESAGENKAVEVPPPAG